MSNYGDYRDVEVLKARVAELEKQRDAAKRDFVDAMERAGDAEIRVAGVEKERDAMVAEIYEAIGIKYESAVDAIVHLKNAVSNLRCDLSVAEKELQKLSAKIAELKRERTSRRKVYAARTDEIDDLRAKLTEVEKERDTWETRANIAASLEKREISEEEFQQIIDQSTLIRTLVDALKKIKGLSSICGSDAGDSKVNGIACDALEAVRKAGCGISDNRPHNHKHSGLVHKEMHEQIVGDLRAKLAEVEANAKRATEQLNEECAKQQRERCRADAAEETVRNMSKHIAELEKVSTPAKSLKLYEEAIDCWGDHEGYCPPEVTAILKRIPEHGA